MSHFTLTWLCVVKHFYLIKSTDALISQIYFVKKLYMFLAVPLPIIRSFPLYILHRYMWCNFDDSFQARLVLLESYHQTCMTYTSAECTVENSWWWAEELPETWVAVTLSRWCEGWYIGRWGARRDLNSRSTNYPDHGHHGDSPPTRKIPIVEPGIETGTSWLVVRSSDH